MRIYEIFRKKIVRANCWKFCSSGAADFPLLGRFYLAPIEFLLPAPSQIHDVAGS
jgi:hypothetical protein